MEVALKYRELQRTNGPRPVTHRQLAAEAKVSKGYAQKIINELRDGGLQGNKPGRVKTGVGSRTLTKNDEAVLLELRSAQANRTLEDYRRELFQWTGTLASESTICRWFQETFPHKGSLVKPNLVPRDKFTLENLLRTIEYLNLIRQVDRHRLKFCDEKLIKGSEIYSAKVRRDPMTGRADSVIVDSDFRNNWTVVGFCGISRASLPFDFYIHEDTNNAATFAWCVEQSVQKGFLQPWDVLVLDNASIHRYRDAATPEDWLCDNYRILLVFLPTRSPELNPTDLMWNVLVQKLKHWDLRGPRPMRGAVARAAQAILSSFTHDDIEKAYTKCGY